MKKNKKADFNVIDTFCKLSEIMENMGTDRFNTTVDMLKNGPYTAEIAEETLRLSQYLHTTPLETMLFVATYSKQLIRENYVDFDDIARFFDVSAVRILPLRPCLNELVDKGILNKKRPHRGQDFCVNPDVTIAMQNNERIKITKKSKMDRYQFCSMVSDLIDARGDGEFSTHRLFEMVENLEQTCGHLKMIKQLEKLQLDKEERTFFYEACDDHLQRYSLTSIGVTLRDIYSNTSERMVITKQFLDEEHPLQTKGLIELCPANFSNEAEIVLTEKGRKLFLEEDAELFNAKQGMNRDLVQPKDIQEKRLFFEEKLTEQLSLLENSLKVDQLEQLQQRLEASALPKGVTVLFYGLPGTGKTEAAMQLAKATGRGVLHVDISACKSKWFGDSEKIMKGLFSTYREMCKREKVKPILLFNEADALFSKRKDVETGNCAQTENAIQNIMLEEMERLDGILIATTNLIKNFDGAFARRFLFKVPFDKPTVEAKKSIWKDKLSWLRDEDAAMLAQRYDLSGGEIDNVVRKSLMEEVIKGQRPTVEMLSRWSSEEKFGNEKGQAIGFSA